LKLHISKVITISICNVILKINGVNTIKATKILYIWYSSCNCIISDPRSVSHSSRWRHCHRCNYISWFTFIRGYCWNWYRYWSCRLSEHVCLCCDWLGCNCYSITWSQTCSRRDYVPIPSHLNQNIPLIIVIYITIKIGVVLSYMSKVKPIIDLNLIVPICTIIIKIDISVFCCPTPVVVNKVTTVLILKISNITICAGFCKYSKIVILPAWTLLVDNTRWTWCVNSIIVIRTPIVSSLYEIGKKTDQRES